MKKSTLGLLMLFIFSNVYAELPYVSLSVIAESGLILREEPNTNSTVITTIPFGTKVRRYHDNWVSDTINDRTDYWMPVEYQDKRGYVWGLYLSTHQFVETSDINSDYRIISEGFHCSQIGYSPDFFWYGLYDLPDSGLQEIRQIKLQVYLPKLLSPEELQNKFKDESIGEDGHIFLIETDQTDKSIFLFGSKNEIITGQVQGFSFLGYSQESLDKPIFIYPEQPKSFRLENNYSTSFMARDIPYFVDSANYIISSKYTLMLCQGDIKTAESFDTKNAQNITDELDFIGRTAKVHSSRQNPTIIWYGDIDGDNKLDFVLSGHNMVEHGGISGYIILFLSSSSEKKEIIRKVAKTISWGCYG